MAAKEAGKIENVEQRNPEEKVEGSEMVTNVADDSRKETENMASNEDRQDDGATVCVSDTQSYQTNVHGSSQEQGPEEQITESEKYDFDEYSDSTKVSVVTEQSYEKCSDSKVEEKNEEGGSEVEEGSSDNKLYTNSEGLDNRLVFDSSLKSTVTHTSSETKSVCKISCDKSEVLKDDIQDVQKPQMSDCLPENISAYPEPSLDLLQREEIQTTCISETKLDNDKHTGLRLPENPFHCVSADESRERQESEDVDLKSLEGIESSDFDKSSVKDKDSLIEQTLTKADTLLLPSKPASEEDQESLDKDPRIEDSLPFISENSNSSLPERVMPESVTDTLDISMDAYTESERSETPMFDTPGPATPASSIMETGSVSAGPTPSKRSRQNSTGSSANVDTGNEDPEQFPASKLFEYQWPQDSSGEYYMLQEQISEFLGVKSFKRKYPELQRRTVDMNERVFLREKGAVTETQCDLGLTAVKSEDVYDLMLRDYPDKYQEYAAVLHERERQTMKEKHKEYGAPKLEKSKMTEYIKKATRSASEWNAMFLREKREERRAYFDLQTFNVHYPKGRYKTLPQDLTKPSPYPVTLIPGQFQDYYKLYSEDEMKYLPVNTVLYNPPKQLGNRLANPNEPASEEENSGEDTEEKDGTDSDSEDESSSDSDDSSTQQEDGTVVTEESQPDKSQELLEAKCRICNLGIDETVKVTEDLVQCSECKQNGHPSCLDLTMEMVAVIKTYPWQCMECKTCVECMDPYDEDKMMFCDRCDRGYHTFCVGLRSIPTGRWKCRSCKAPEAPKTPKSASKSRGRGRKRGNHTPSTKPNSKIKTSVFDSESEN